jgi:hypothetical protein
MTDPFEEARRLLERRDDLAAIRDDDTDRIREQMRTDFIKILRAGIGEISRLPNNARPDLEARRRAEIEWLAAVLESMSPPQ